MVRHKVWNICIYEMGISKQNKIENIYEAVSEIGDMQAVDFFINDR